MNLTRLAYLLCPLCMSFLVLACSDDDETVTDTGVDQTDVSDTSEDTTADQEVECTPDPDWDVVVNLKVDDTTTPVNLGCLEQTTYMEGEAIRLTRVVETLALETPYNYHYNFIGSDGFNPLTDKLDGNLGGLPYYAELDLGFLYWTEEDQLRIGWDESLGFPGYLAVRGMDGGTIDLIEVDASNLIVHVGEARAVVDLDDLDTESVTDYRHPEDGDTSVIPLPAILTAAGVITGSDFAYKLTGTDGWSNNDDNLMPFANVQHAYLDPSDRSVLFAEESWDTEECCWRVKDLVLMRGVAVE